MTSSSGFVPGKDVDGRMFELCFAGGGRGPNDVSLGRLGVISAKFMALSIIFLLFEGLYVMLTA